MGSLSVEIDIDLTLNEVIRLEDEKLSGELEVRSEDGTRIPPRKIHLAVRDFPVASRNLYINLESFPKTSFELIEGYRIFISFDGYRILKEKGRIVDRPGHNSRVTITSQKDYPSSAYLSE